MWSLCERLCVRPPSRHYHKVHEYYLANLIVKKYASKHGIIRGLPVAGGAFLKHVLHAKQAYCDNSASEPIQLIRRHPVRVA